MNSSSTFFLCTYTDFLNMYLGLESAFYLLNQTELLNLASGQGCHPRAREEPEAAAATAVVCLLPHSRLGGWPEAFDLRMVCISGGCTFSTNFSLGSQACWLWGPHIMDALCRQLPMVQEAGSHLKMFLRARSPLLSENKLAPCSFPHQEGAC